MTGCIFCQIAAGELPASFVYQDDRVSAFLDIQPVNPGHLLVVPHRHAETLGALPPDVVGHMMTVAQRLMLRLHDTDVRCEGINLFLAEGVVAGQEVDHVHLHVIPRFTGDGFGLRFAADYGTLPQRDDLDRVAAAIRDGWDQG